MQPLSAGNSTEFSQADNSKTMQRRAKNRTGTSLDFLGSWESINVHFKPIKQVETGIKSLYRQPEQNSRSILVTQQPA